MQEPCPSAVPHQPQLGEARHDLQSRLSAQTASGRAGHVSSLSVGVHVTAAGEASASACEVQYGARVPGAHHEQGDLLRVVAHVSHEPARPHRSSRSHDWKR